MLHSKIKYRVWLGTVIALILAIISPNAQASTVCPPFTGPVADFCNMRVRDQLCVNGDIIVGGMIIGGNGLGYANTLIVDKNGNDALATRDNQLHFLTISAALAQALPRDIVWVFPGTYDETLVVPAGVILAGIASTGVLVQQFGVTTPTDMVTVGAGATINNINFLVTAAADVPIRGIVLTGSTTPLTTTISNGQIIIDTTAAGLTTSNVYGISYNSAGNPAFTDVVIGFSAVVITASLGVVRGLLVDQPNLIALLNSQMLAFGVTNAIAVETTHPSATVQSVASLFNGSTADISQTAGTLAITAVSFANSEANGLGFTNLIYPNTFIWGNTDALGGNTTLFLRPGTAEVAFTPVVITASQKYLAKALTVHVLVAPGLGESTTITVQKKTPLDLMPVDTILFVTLVDDEMQASNSAVSVHFDQGDEMSVKVVTSSGANTAAVSAVVDIY